MRRCAAIIGASLRRRPYIYIAAIELPRVFDCAEYDVVCGLGLCVRELERGLVARLFGPLEIFTFIYFLFFFFANPTKPQVPKVK